MKIFFFRPAHPERGQSLVELAFSVLVLLLLLAGAVDFGRIFFYYMGLQDAAQEGAVYGSVNPTDCTGITNRVRGTGNSLYGAETVTVFIGSHDCSGGTPPAAQACFGKTVYVSVTNPVFEIATPLLGSFLGSQTIQLRAEARDSVIKAAACP